MKHTKVQYNIKTIYIPKISIYLLLKEIKNFKNLKMAEIVLIIILLILYISGIFDLNV